MARRIEKKDNGERYRQLFFKIPAVMIVFNSDTLDIVAVNQAASEYYGYSVDEFRSMKIFNINVAEQAFLSECIRDTRICGKQTFLFKHRLKNGEVRDVEVYSGVLNSKANILISSIVFDVTDKLKSEKELKESRERLALVLAGTGTGIWDYDLIKKTWYIDKQLKEIMGYEEHELSEGVEEWESYCHPEEIERIYQELRKVEKGAINHCQIEHRMLHKDGTYRWIKTTGKIITNENNQPIRAVGTINDITKLKEIEDRILESQNKLIDFARAIPDVSAIVDEDGRYIEVFGSDKLFFKPNEKIEGKTFHQLFPKELADLMLKDIKQVILTGENKSMIREMDFGLEKRYFEGRSAPMNYRVNGKKTVVVVVSEITERFKVDQMLKFTYELQRKSDFINDILSGKVTYNEDTISMSKELGINLSIPICCFLIDAQEVSGQNSNNINTNHLKNQTNQIIFLISTSTKYFVWNNREKIGVFCQGEDSENLRGQCLRSASELKNMMSNAYPELTFSIAISDIHRGFSGLEKSYQEAWRTLVSAHCQVQVQGGIYHYRDLGLFQILTSIYGEEYCSEFVRKMIGPLIEYDSEKGTFFLMTLEEILQSNNLKDSANKLFIHYKTLVFRRKRIEKILGVSLDSFDTRLALASAIKLYKLNKLFNK